MNTSYKSKFMVAIMLICMSCNKYLDKKPDSSLAVPTHLSDLQALLDYSNNMNLELTPSFGETTSDDYFMTDDVLATFDQVVQKAYTFNRTDYTFPNDWSATYNAVYYANYCLDLLGEIPVTGENKSVWNNVKGSSLFFRSYNILNLLWIHALAFDEATAGKDLGVVLRRSSDFNVPSVRSTVRECYDQVLSDAYNALDYLPAVPLNKFRPSKTAVYGLLARTYLSMRSYDSAYKYANLTLGAYSDLMDYNSDESIDWTVEGNSPFILFNKEVIFHTEMNFSIGLYGSDYSEVDTTLYASYSPNDLRRDAFYWVPAGYAKYRGSYTGAYWKMFTGIATDEMYLIRAECSARSNHLPEAMNDLNALLVKRWNNQVPYIALTAADKDDALNKILLERRKELTMRGLRWMDIKRLNKEDRNISIKHIAYGKTYILPPNSPYFALPLPTDIIQLTGLPQN